VVWRVKAVKRRLGAALQELGTELCEAASKYMGRMKKLVSIVGLLLLLGLAGVAAEPDLLPEKFGDWQAAGPAQTTAGKASQLPAMASKDALAKEAGLLATEERSYKNGADELKLAVSTFQDPSGAYQFYTQVLQPGMKRPTPNSDAVFNKHSGVLLIGNLVVVMAATGELNPDTLNGFVPALKTKADRTTPYPPLKNYLPEKGLIEGTQRYALGPEGFRAAMNALDQAAYADLSKDVGFLSGVEAILARYKTDQGTGVLLLLEYPTPQLAEQHLHHLEEAFPAIAKQAGVDAERNASLLSVVFGAKSKEFARELRKNVNYETQVTRNEPGQTLTDPPWVLILSKIFFLTAIFLGVATGVGVAFGGVRVLTKRLFPGKVFDRPQDIEVLQLGLSGKKIDPSDMY
jgi:hypothetical protein